MSDLGNVRSRADLQQMALEWLEREPHSSRTKAESMADALAIGVIALAFERKRLLARIDELTRGPHAVAPEG